MKSHIKKAKIVLPMLAIGLALTGATAYAAETGATTTILKHFNIELSDEQKAAMDEIRQLRADGKTEEAKALAESVGLPAMKMRGGHGSGPGMNDEMKAKHEAMHTALENNDYAAFKAATVDAPFADKVDEAFFAKMAEAHTLRESGDHEGAHAIMEELGFPQRGEGHGPHGGMHGQGKFFLRADNLTDAQKAQLEEAKTLFQNGDIEAAKTLMKAVHDELRATATTTN